MSKQLTRAAIFGIPNFGFRMEKVEIPEWDGHVYVRSISRTEGDAFDMTLPNATARFAVLVACDEKGKPLFGEDDHAELGRHWKVPVDRIVLAGRKLNGLTPEDLEEAEKNSAKGPISDSSSPSLGI